MESDYFIGIAQQALWVLALGAAPILIPALVAGVLLGMVQAATSINEATLSFVPKADRGRHLPRAVRQQHHDAADRFHAGDFRADPDARAELIAMEGFALPNVEGNAAALDAGDDPPWRGLSCRTDVRRRQCAGAIAAAFWRWPSAFRRRAHPEWQLPAAGIISLARLSADRCREVMVGLAIGFALQIGFAAALLAGEAISNAMGIGFAAMADPASGQMSPAIGQFLSMLATFLFLAIDGHLALIAIIVESYRRLAAGRMAIGRRNWRAGAVWRTDVRGRARDCHARHSRNGDRADHDGDDFALRTDAQSFLGRNARRVDDWHSLAGNLDPVDGRRH